MRDKIRIGLILTISNFLATTQVVRATVSGITINGQYSVVWGQAEGGMTNSSPERHIYSVYDSASSGSLTDGVSAPWWGQDLSRGNYPLGSEAAPFATNYVSSVASPFYVSAQYADCWIHLGTYGAAESDTYFTADVSQVQFHLTGFIDSGFPGFGSASYELIDRGTGAVVDATYWPTLSAGNGDINEIRTYTLRPNGVYDSAGYVLRLNLNYGAGDGTSGSAYLSVDIVPEPTPFALFGVGALVLIWSIPVRGLEYQHTGENGISVVA
jgi:hypothetical protein